MITEEQRAWSRERVRIATVNARKVLKRGDRIRVTKCPGTKRTITFSHWEGEFEIISKSGQREYCAANIDRLNGVAVDFTNPERTEP